MQIFFLILLPSAIMISASTYAQVEGQIAARELDRVSELKHEFDEIVLTQVHSSGSAADAVPRALLARYLKRIASNLGNVMSSVVMPVDQMDYYGDDEVEDDNEGDQKDS